MCLLDSGLESLIRPISSNFAQILKYTEKLTSTKKISPGAILF